MAMKTLPLWLTLCLAALPGLAAEPVGQAAKWDKLSGPELVERLQNPKTRLPAFRELARRSDEATVGELNSAEVIVCPQGTAKKPVYIVLSNFEPGRGTCHLRQPGYSAEKPEELFGPPPEPAEHPIYPHGRLDRRSDLVIYAFTHDGKQIAPFGGNNMLESGMIADLNGDGLIERADQTSYGVEGVENAQVLEVCAVAERPRPLLAVAYNFGPAADWDYQFSDHGPAGTIAIEFGPVVAPGVVARKVVFVWDKAKGGYVAAQGKQSPHLRLLQWTDYGSREFWPQFERWKKEGLSFPADPKAKGTSGGDRRGWPILGPREPREPPSPPPAKPYRYASLRTLSNPQLVAYMGAGKTAQQFRQEQVVPTQIPAGFWTMPPKRAALAMVDANRNAEHRRDYRLALDDRDGRQPPAASTIYFSFRSSRCYVTADSKGFVRVDPKASYYAYTSESGLGAVFYNVVHPQPIYDLRYVELPYADARHAADVTWWLRRARTWTADEECGSMQFSTGDGDGRLAMTSPGGTPVEAGGRVWGGAVSERWTEHFGEETLLNLAAHLFRVAIPERLGQPWSRQEPRHGERWALARVLKMPATQPQAAASDAARAQQALVGQAREQVGRLIGLFSADQSRLPHAMLRVAVEAAGDFALAEFRPQLQALLQQLPAGKQPVRTRAEVERLLDEARKRSDSSPSKSKEETAALYEEQKALEHGLRPDAAGEELRQAAVLALRKLDLAGDPERLQAWAQSPAPGWQWALARLEQTDKRRYVAALQWWLPQVKGEASRQFFAAIAEADARKALEVAKQLPAGGKGDLTVAAYSALEQAQATADVGKRVEALIQVALDPKSGCDQRCRAIEALAPEKEPLRFADGRIDESLVRLLDPKLAGEPLNFTLTAACRALALRGRMEQFDRMLGLLSRQEDGDIHNRILRSLVLLAQRGGAEQRDKLLAVLRPHLKRTNRLLSEIILYIYALDLRELKGDLECIATADPEDYESRQASSYGGAVTPVTGRFHAARKVVAVWNEEDLLTRAKLLIAFDFAADSDAYDAVHATVCKQVQELADAFPRDRAQKVIEFMDWYEKEVLKPSADGTPRSGQTELGKLVRAAFLKPRSSGGAG
jgi:hypothetical protein